MRLMSILIWLLATDFLNGARQKCDKATSEMLRLRNISTRLCHNCQVVENFCYPQLDTVMWKTSVDNSKKVWKEAIFPAISRKFAVDNTVENWGKLWKRCGKTGEERCTTL